MCVGGGGGGGTGAAAPLNAGSSGLHPPKNLHQRGLGARCEEKCMPAQLMQFTVIHSGMAQKSIESFFAPALRRIVLTVVQGK